VRCTCPRGHRFVTSVLTAVDLAADASLVESLGKGGTQLVRCPACGSVWPVAEPVVLHSPKAGRVAVLVPDVIAHTELEVLARLLQEVARSGAGAAPAYAADLAAVVGDEALRSWLDLPPDRDPGAGAQSGSVSMIPRIHSAFADLAGPERVSSTTIPPVAGGEDVEAGPDPDDDWLDDRKIGAGEAAKPSRPAASRASSDRAPKPPGAGIDYVNLMSEAEEDPQYEEFDDPEDDDGSDGPDGGFGFGRRI